MSLTKNMAEIAKWRKFANTIKAKRTNVAIKNNSKSGVKVSNNGCQCDVSILERKEPTVQPLTTEATGKAKKYERTGPQEFVNIPYEPDCRVGQFSTRSWERNQTAPEVRVRKTAKNSQVRMLKCSMKTLKWLKGLSSHLVHMCIYQYLYVLVCSPRN
jgi:hypothetical protein